MTGRTKLEHVAGRSSYAISHNNILNDEIPVVGLQDIGVVTCVNVTILNQHILRLNVEPVIVVVRMIVDLHPPRNDLFALGGAYRQRDDADCIVLFQKALAEDEVYALPAAIAIIVLFVISIVSLVLYKKSSALFLLGGVTEVASSVFFFAMEANVNKFYSTVTDTYHGKITFVPVINWVSYVAGALLLLAGAYAIYKAILMMRDEIKHPQSQAGGPTYSYLKK